MSKGLLEKLGRNLKWFVLEVNVCNKSDSYEYLESLKSEIAEAGYELRQVFRSTINPDLYHLHCGEKQGVSSPVCGIHQRHLKDATLTHFEEGVKLLSREKIDKSMTATQWLNRGKQGVLSHA